MRIGIIGGGSIGLLFAHYLSDQNEITVYTRTKHQAEAISAGGITLQRGDVTEKAYVRAMEMADWGGDEDFTIIAVKQYHLPKMMPRLLKYHRREAAFLFLQNGMGHLPWLRKLLSANVFVGVVEHGSMKISETDVVHTGIGKTKTALFHGEDMEMISQIAKMADCNFVIEIMNDYDKMLKEKLLANAIINPLTAVLQVKNGELIEEERYAALFHLLYEEVSGILELEDREQGLGYVKQICAQTRGNRSSMLKDVEAGRETEIDAILGYLLELSEEKQISAPLVKTYYFAVKGMESRRG